MRIRRNFWKKRRVWAGLMAILTCIQMVVLYGIDQFLRSPSLTAAAAINTAQQPEVSKPDVPVDATRSVYSPDNQYAAYTTKENELVIIDSEGERFRDRVGEITYFEWLGTSNTLVYFVRGNNLTGYLLHVNQPKPTQMYRWFGTKREVINTYFSPYMEFLYIELRNGSRTEVYKYDAVDGINQLPLGDVQIGHIHYDDKSDIMTLTTASGEEWRYERDRLYRPDGSEVRQSQPVRHRRANGVDYPISSSEGKSS